MNLPLLEEYLLQGSSWKRFHSERHCFYVPMSESEHWMDSTKSLLPEMKVKKLSCEQCLYNHILRRHSLNTCAMCVCIYIYIPLQNYVVILFIFAVSTWHWHLANRRLSFIFLLVVTVCLGWSFLRKSLFAVDSFIHFRCLLYEFCASVIQVIQ